MSEQPLNLTILLQEEVEGNVDEEILDEFTRVLLADIREQDVESARLAEDTRLLDGAKGVPVIIGSIVAGLASAGVFTALLQVLRPWVQRQAGRTIRLKAETDAGKFELVLPEQDAPEEIARFLGAITGAKERSETDRKVARRPDMYSLYEAALDELLRRLGRDHPEYRTALVYQQQLRENISEAQRHGDYAALEAERSRIIDRLNELALSMLDVSFNEIYQQASAAIDDGGNEHDQV